ncbi:hydrogenase nickel incorporation protein [Citrobacter koseri]|uniref:Hydrogenase nickel incorporation protein n=1 Tax=Citrobacter koseri TaxID=545 RepID=A0A2X2X2J5_CITKO|nr:hydrogenase nickel incorporation protein [Citrobacter koseri]
MHEITLCQRALELIEQQAAAHGAKRVTGVWLKIGAFSCVKPALSPFVLIWYAVAPWREGCKLHLEEQEVRMLVRVLSAVRHVTDAARAPLSAMPERHVTHCGR